MHMSSATVSKIKSPEHMLRLPRRAAARDGVEADSRGSMVFSYLRMRCPVEEAMARYGRWIGAPELGPPRLVRERDKIDLALADGTWLGLAVFIYLRLWPVDSV
jgi:hypothetical protein